MQRLCLLVLLVLLPDSARARCAPFDFFTSVDRIPIVVHARVTQSNKDRLLATQCNPTVCRHRFSAEVLEILKGSTGEPKLQFEYDYVEQRPNIAVFGGGEEYVFAVSSIRAGGEAKLFGTTCGRSGLEIKYLDKVKR